MDGANVVKEMLFPVEEIPFLRKRLKDGLKIYTTRVSHESDKYSFFDIVKTNISDDLLIVSGIFEISSLSEHPLLLELTEEHKQEILSYEPPYKLISLVKMEN